MYGDDVQWSCLLHAAAAAGQGFGETATVPDDAGWTDLQLRMCTWCVGPVLCPVSPCRRDTHKYTPSCKSVKYTIVYMYSCRQRKPAPATSVQGQGGIRAEVVNHTISQLQNYLDWHVFHR